MDDQPALGRVADGWGHPASYLTAAGVQLLALPLLVLARRERAPPDAMPVEGGAVPRPAGAVGGEGDGARS